MVDSHHHHDCVSCLQLRVEQLEAERDAVEETKNQWVAQAEASRQRAAELEKSFGRGPIAHQCKLRCSECEVTIAALVCGECIKGKIVAYIAKLDAAQDKDTPQQDGARFVLRTILGHIRQL